MNTDAISNATTNRPECLSGLDLVVAAAREEFKQTIYDVGAVQHGCLRTYLWLSSVLFAAGAALLTKILESGGEGFAAIPLFLVLPALGLVFASFLLAVQAMTGPMDFHALLGGRFAECGDCAVSMDGVEFRTRMLKTLEMHNTEHIAAVSCRGRRLRLICKLIMASSILSAAAYCAFFLPMIF